MSVSSSTPAWWVGAVVGFIAAFGIQALAGHWKLWVDHRKAVIDDLMKAIDEAKSSAERYYSQERTKGAVTKSARDVTYTQRRMNDLYGVLNFRFGPLSQPCGRSFRRFRELTTGSGWGEEGKADDERAYEISVAAAACIVQLRDWQCGQLSFFKTAWNWVQRIFLWFKSR